MANVAQEVVGMTAHVPMTAHERRGHGMQAHAREGITKIVIAAHEQAAHEQVAHVRKVTPAQLVIGTTDHASPM